jgi:hypothetical protein
MYRERILAWLAAMPIRGKLLAYVRESGARAYLVGGTVRDALLDRPSVDLDLAVEADAMALARRAADRFGGAFVPLDVDRDVARVVLRVGDQHLHFDLAGLRAENIVADLWARDYTVNAMAVSLDDSLELLDPTGGQADLAARSLRIARSDAFASDPIRVLRGIRLRGSLGLALTPETEALARHHASALQSVSVERVRDELAQVLALEDAAESLAYAGGLGILSIILPEFGHDDALLALGTRAVAALEGLAAPLRVELLGLHEPAGHAIPAPPRTSTGPAIPAESSTPAIPVIPALAGIQPPDAADVLLEYAPDLVEAWGQELTVGRTRWQGLKLGALLSVLPGGSATVEAAARRLHLAKTEMRQLRGMVQGREGLLRLSRHAELEPLEIYRFFREVAEAGLDAAVLSLALAADPAYPEGRIDRALLTGVVRQLMEAWFDRHAALVSPPALLSGHDLVLSLPVKPGPILGELLELLREVQVQGLVVTRHEALAYLRTYLLGQR